MQPSGSAALPPRQYITPTGSVAWIMAGLPVPDNWWLLPSPAVPKIKCSLESSSDFSGGSEKEAEKEMPSPNVLNVERSLESSSDFLGGSEEEGEEVMLSPNVPKLERSLESSSDFSGGSEVEVDEEMPSPNVPKTVCSLESSSDFSGASEEEVEEETEKAYDKEVDPDMEDDVRSMDIMRCNRAIESARQELQALFVCR